MARKDVILDRGDTDTCRDSGSSSASRQTYVTGRAVYEAGLKLRDFLQKRGYYKGKTLRDIYRFAKDEGKVEFEASFNPSASPLDEQGQGIPYATYAFATHMTEVQVAENTGECRVKKVWAAHDVGRGVNPQMIKGQIYGGVAMGIGLALMEEFIPGKTVSLDTYYIPTAMDVPGIEAFIVEDEEPTARMGQRVWASRP